MNRGHGTAKVLCLIPSWDLTFHNVCTCNFRIDQNSSVKPLIKHNINLFYIDFFKQSNVFVLNVSPHGWHSPQWLWYVRMNLRWNPHSQKNTVKPSLYSIDVQVKVSWDYWASFMNLLQLRFLESYLNIQDQRSQNTDVRFKFSPKVLGHKESLCKLTLEWNFLSKSEMDQTGNPSWSTFQIQKILNIQQQRFLRTTGKPWDLILASHLPNKLDFSTLLQTL